MCQNNYRSIVNDAFVYTYAFSLEGNCCWELFGEKFFKGDGIKLKQKLPSGFAGVPGFPKFKAASVKKSQPKGKLKKC